MLLPINLQQWIDDHRAQLKPPVGNKVIYPERDFIVMVVSGPNSRDDYHVDPREEFFYQLEGDMTLKVMESDGPRSILIKQGEILLLPPKVPHTPLRPADTIGLVIEHKRLPDQLDGFQWFCDHCHHLVYEDFFHLTNIEKQCKEAMERFQARSEDLYCPGCQQPKLSKQVEVANDI